MALYNRSQSGLTVGEIVKVTGHSHQNVNSGKDSLGKKGLINQHLPARDQRTVKVYLTEKGKQQAKELWANLSKLGAFRDEWITRKEESEL